MQKYELFLGLKQNDGVAINRDVVLQWLKVQLTQHNIKGASFESILGYWEGDFENSLKLVVVIDSDISSICALIGKIYCHDFKQDAVLLTVSPTEATLIDW